MNRTLAVLRALVSLVLGIVSVVFVLGLTDPESRWSARTLVILGFCALFVAYCIWILVRAFRKRPEK